MKEDMDTFCVEEKETKDRKFQTVNSNSWLIKVPLPSQYC